MNKPINGEPFITMEDITGNNENQNIVIYNWTLPEKRRIQLFKQYMIQRFPWVHFTKKQIDTILTFHPGCSKELIVLIKKYIHELKST